MPLIDLKYGREHLPLEYDPDSVQALAAASEARPLTDAEIGLALDAPIDSPTLDEIVRPSDTVLLVVPDATRQSGCGQIVNLLVRRLIANGSSPDKINIIFATGIHRRVTDEEKKELLTPFIAQRINTIDHGAENTLKNFRVGQTSGGIDVGLNWRLTEYDHVVIIGSVTFHYFAGFTGGRKLICPGLASDDTIEATHKLAFDCETRDRRKGVGTGLVRALIACRKGAIFLEVRESNQIARKFYKSLGFQEVGLRLEYYYSPPESGIVMKFYS